MKYYLDSEFVDDGHTVDLISIGIVAEDGREYYAQSCDFKAQRANKWVQENVFPHLSHCPRVQGKYAGTDIARQIATATHLHRYGECINPFENPGREQCPWRERSWIAHEIKQFIQGDNKPVFIGWCSSYDWVALCQLYGTMMDIPQGWPHYIKDIQYILDEQGISDEMLPQQEDQAHNALSDARHIKSLWEWLTGGEH